MKIDWNRIKFGRCNEISTCGHFEFIITARGHKFDYTLIYANVPYVKNCKPVVLSHAKKRCRILLDSILNQNSGVLTRNELGKLP